MGSSRELPESPTYSSIKSRRRVSILKDHLNTVVLAGKQEALLGGLTLISAIPPKTSPSPDQPPQLQGGISEQDLRCFHVDFSNIGREARESLINELDMTLTSVAEYLYGTLEETHNTSTVIQDLERLRESLANDQAALEQLHQRIQNLISKVVVIHPNLSEHLSNSLTAYPPKLNTIHSATHDLLSASIETSLLKLSLIRTQAHVALYGTPNLTTALSCMHGSLSFKESALDEENEKLDRELAQYEAMLKIIDTGGGFAQVVDDWITVKKDTEACRKDLRRLGWTGD